jgi:hypothetical protein
MLGSFVSGLLMLGFGALIVDGVLKRRELKRWRQVAHLACHTLGDVATRGIVTGLAALWTDDAHLATAPAQARPDWNTANLDPVNEIREIPEGRGDVRLFRDPALPGLDDRPSVAAVPRTRLARLIADDEWRSWAIPYLRELRTRGRELVPQWAPVMIMAEEPRALLNRVAHLNDDLGVLREHIERISEKALRGLAPEQSEIETTITAWAKLDREARVLTNELWAMAGHGHYSFAA